MRNEISDSWRISFSVSFATPWPAYEGCAAPDSLADRRFLALCELGGADLACGGGGRPLAEVRGARDGAVVARPALALAQRLLDPVEAPEPAAEVVDHVHERGLARARDDRRAVLELAVVAQDDVKQGLCRLRRETRQLLDLAPHQVVAEWDLAVQLARVGELDRGAVHGVRLDLADVVQERAGDRHVAIDARERGGEGVHALCDGQAVLEQAVLVGLVVVLGRGRLGPPAEHLRAVAEEALEQAGEVGIAYVGEELVETALHDVQREGR